MKITGLETFVVGNPPPHFGGRYFIFLKLVTDDGIEGIGEVYAATFGPHVVTRMIEDVCARHVIGADPFHIERLWRDVYGQRVLRAARHLARRRAQRDRDGVLGHRRQGGGQARLRAPRRTGARAAARVHLPLPGARETPPTSTSIPPSPAERAAEYAARGFTALKFDPAGHYTTFDPRQPGLEELDRCERYVRGVREAVGNRCDLLFGTHGQFTPSGAIRLAKRLEPFAPLWFEEPTPPEMPEEMARVARATSIPVATGERLTTKYEFSRVLETGAASILQLNLGRVGGLLEAKKIAALAEVHYAQIAPHLYCGPVVGAANIQLSACSPNFLLLEGILDWGGFHAEILKTPITWDDGYVIPPTAPGLGVELDEEVAARHPYDGDDLHLTPVFGPHPDLLRAPRLPGDRRREPRRAEIGAECVLEQLHDHRRPGRAAVRLAGPGERLLDEASRARAGRRARRRARGRSRDPCRRDRS